MAITLKLSKTEGGAPWGFRLVGGVDFEQPVVVVKVNADSLAESAGLEVGDIVVRVNDTSTAGLTHNEVHDLLLSAGLEVELGIRRGELTTRIISDEDYDIEESNAIRKAIEEEVLNEAITIINNMKNSIDTAKEKSEHRISENLSGQEEIINTVRLQSTSEVKKGEKWSTFLVRPDKPVPKSKKKVEEKPKDDTYKVVIKKQTRRPSREKRVQFDQNVTELEVDFENGETADTNTRELESVEVEVNVYESEEITVDEAEASSDYEIETNEEETQIEESETGSVRKDSVEMERERLEGLKPIDETEIKPSLEEQLLVVQKQLQALSQLPSAIQLTLDAVSKQLASIVGARESVERNGDQGECTSSSKEEEEPQTEEEYLEDTSLSEKAEAELLREDSDVNSSIGEELEEDQVEKDVEEENEGIEEREPSPYSGLTEEEREAEIKKEALEAKKQKTMEERTPRPIQRPIILPGGRKWSNPEDAIPIFRKPKMSDDKIIETIESNLEVIIGNRKGWTTGTPFGPGLTRSSQSTGIFEKFWKIGMIHYIATQKESNCWKVPSRVVATKHINFLKYQPPPKNLDYLQRSEVYRLVHDMEPPVRGITSRAEKVLAEQDYYEASKGEP